MGKAVRKYQRVSNKKKGKTRKHHKQKKHHKQSKSRKSRKQSKTRKYLQKRKRGGKFTLTTETFFGELDKVYGTVSVLLEEIECPERECREYISGRTVCVRYEDDEKGEKKNVGCGKSIISDLQSKLLKIRGNYITPEDVLNDNDSDYVDVGVVYYYGRVYTLYEVFQLINKFDKELMDTKIMEDVNKYLNGKLDFFDLCEKTFKNMEASSTTAKLPYYNMTMSELGEIFRESAHDYADGYAMGGMENENPINEVIDNHPQHIISFPETAQQNNL